MVRLSAREKIETALGRAVLSLPPPLVRALAGPPIERDGRTLDAQAQLALRAEKIAGKRPTHALTVAECRRDLDVSATLLGPTPAPMAAVEDCVLDGLRLRVYRAHEAPPASAALLFFHGGGHTGGSLASHDLVCREMAGALGSVVIAIDYRLAPEHPFPAAADDATASFRAVVSASASLGVDRHRIAVGGDSAGGNLAAVVALDTRGDAVRPCAQLLVYPVLDLTMSFPSVITLGSGFFLEAASIAWYRRHYLGDGDRTDPRASPWFAEDLRGLPRAIVITAGFDPLRDEGDAYARRLEEAGVRVDHRSYASLFHGFWNTTGIVRAARAAFDEVITLLRAT